MKTLLEAAEWYLREEDEPKTPETPEKEQPVDSEQAQAQGAPQPNKETSATQAPETTEQRPAPQYEEVKKWLDENRNQPLVVVMSNICKHFMCDNEKAKEMIKQYISEFKG